MTRVAIIAAMPGELKPLVRGWQHQRRNGVDLWRWKFDRSEWIAACAGAGVDAATRAFVEAERDGAVSSVISTGWAGALSAGLEAGQPYWVSGVVDARTGEQFRAEGFEVAERDGDLLPHPSDKDKDVARVGHPTMLWLVTSPKVADEAEKHRLAAAYGAELVDMEAAAVARLAAMREIPFYCVKGISDGLTDQLPDFNRFIAENGQFKLLLFILFILIRPWHWPALMRMGENSSKAACGIRESLLEFLDRHDNQGALENRNGCPNFKP
jgi:adenosylhomocysteine nucleosidase